MSSLRRSAILFVALPVAVVIGGTYMMLGSSEIASTGAVAPRQPTIESDSPAAGQTTDDTADPKHAMDAPDQAGADAPSFALDFDPVERLRKLGLDESFDSLVSILNDRQASPEVRYLCAIAIGQSGLPAAYDILASFQNDPSTEVRVGAIRGLAELNDSRAIPLLTQSLLGDDALEVKHASLTALAKSNTREARGSLVSAAEKQGQDRDIRITIIEVLKRQPDLQVDAFMQSLLTDSDAEVRARAAVSLSRRFGDKYDDELVAVAQDRTLPNYVWSDVVRQLEVSSGRNFYADAHDGYRAIPDQAHKQAVNESIRAWWSGIERSQ